ncbi:MAG: hypothetical protein AB1521_05420 [Bacteroidota bacterium]
MKKYIKLLLALLIILSSCKLKEDTTGTDDTGGDGTITIKVTSPNGAENLMEGSSHEVRWTGTGTEYIRILFSVDNGSSWSLVADSVKNVGVFVWFPIPNVISNQCKIRVSSVDGQSSDESDNVFNIIKNSNESLRIDRPQGGEAWEGGTAKEIRWYSSGLDSIKIEYTTDNGNHWSLIAIDRKNTGIYYWEPVPNTPSTLAQIRIMDASDGNPSAVSNVFSILPEPVIRVLSPNGGETLLSGGSRKIEWISENIQNVKIAYTTDNGFAWTTITTSTPSIGFFTWDQIPDLNSQLCKIRIYDALDNEPSDVSDSVFTITNQVTQIVEVTSPNGGESWQAGTSQNITWNSSGIQQVKIDFTSNNGLTWNSIVNNHANTGAYEWNVPNSLSTQCLIRVSDAADNDPVDQSNATFKIVPKPELKIIQPNGGETWTAGKIDTIKWTSIGVENVFIDYTPDNGITWTTIVEQTPSDGEYAFSFSGSGTQFKIRILEAINGYPVDESDGTFTVLPEPKITVLSPNGGEEWYPGSSNNILWTSNNIEFVKIEYTTNNGATWNTITNSTPSDGAYSWNTVPDVSSLQCRVRISDAEDGIPADISNDNFTITQPGNQLITVTSPNGGEEWPAGSSQNITWEASGIANVKIEFTTNNGLNWNTIVSSTASDGFYTWTQIPAVTSTNCKVRISDAADNTPSDESDSYFSIAPEPDIVVIQPNGGELIYTGSTVDIQWTSVSVANVKIEYTTNGGAEWVTIISSTPSIGSYYWSSVPAVSSLQCKIKVSDADDGIPSDISDENFQITNQIGQIITVTTPNGGEHYLAGSSVNLTWSSFGVQNVKIEYTTNNGNNWIEIVSSTESDGFYTWSPVPGTASSNCRIRISDASDNLPFDTSDELFSIDPEPSLSIVSPNGGETITFGDKVAIQWTSESVANVKIEYTLNGGATWATIVGSTPSIGTYSWDTALDPLLNTNSEQCRIRISDANDGVPYDVSDQNFSLTNQIVQSITVTSPNGGEKWRERQTRNITWDSKGISLVKIEFTTDNGLTWTLIADNEANTGSYAWTIPASLNSTQCKVRVGDTGGVISDVSDASFSILLTAEIQNILFPQNGDEVIVGEPVTILWESTGIEKVKIEYNYQDVTDPTDWFTLVDSLQNIGSYRTSFSVVDDSYVIRITATDNSASLISGVFKVKPASYITIESPNGGEEWLHYPAADQYEIKWRATNLTNVKIELTTNGGGSWQTLVESTPNDGMFKATFPAQEDSSDLCLIRISDPDDGSPKDESDDFFALHKNKWIRLEFPNTGEDFYKGHPDYGDNLTVIWNSYAVETVDIYYSMDNGVTWTTLVTNQPSTGAYVWVDYPTDAYHTSTQGRLLIIEAGGDPFNRTGEVFDINDVPFWLNIRNLGD